MLTNERMLYSQQQQEQCVHWLALLWDIWMTIWLETMWWPTMNYLPATGLDASLSFHSTSRRCSRKRSPILLPVSPMYIFLHKVHFMQ